ncbi:hypothetical protein NE865_03450 [Phthorimaea operculella]|nr:hypothetical protein NE865_03450 [Phthorimaea operculella]
MNSKSGAPKKFVFAKGSPPPVTTFTGYAFYSIYKEAEFLRSSENIETILAKGYLLRQSLKEVQDGDSVMVDGMNLEKNTPLLIKKTGANVKVEDFEFTHNRLTGLVAAYAYENRHRFPDIKSSEALSLGLVWDNCDDVMCRLYLSAVTGTEHFDDQFSFWPLVCALRKFQQKKMPQELVIKMAKIKNNQGERMAKVFMNNMRIVKKLWAKFPGSSSCDFEALMAAASPQMKALFVI